MSLKQEMGLGFKNILLRVACSDKKLKNGVSAESWSVFGMVENPK